MREATTIGDWLYPAKTLVPDPRRLESLWIQVKEVLSGDFDHLFKVFIKPEAHKVSKIQEGRWRIIAASALPVQVAWHMVVGHLERGFLESQPAIPSAYAESFFGGSWRRFRQFCVDKNLTWATDKSGWDWNSPGWVFEACCELRKRLTIGATPEWERALRLLYRDAYVDSRLLLSTGHIYKQDCPGLMKSGLVVTISDNSISQVLMDAAACLDRGERPSLLKATGDDLLQRKPRRVDDYLKRLSKFGCVVKHHKDSIEFMGFDMNDAIRPIYPHKHLWNVLHQKDEFLPDTLDAYCRIYAKCPDFQVFWQRLAQKLGVTVSSPQYYAYFMDNPEAMYGLKLGSPSFKDNGQAKRLCAEGQ